MRCFEFVTHRKKVCIIWYILHCPDGCTAEWIRLCKEKVSRDILKDVFTVSYERMKRYQGAWHLEWENVFPNYIFLESEEEEALTAELEQYAALKHALLRADGLLSVSERTQVLLQELSGETHRIPLSTGIIRKGVTCVTEGPLKGMEKWITKIDRHKRLAFLDAGSIPGVSSMKAGLEITEKNL